MDQAGLRVITDNRPFLLDGGLDGDFPPGGGVNEACSHTITMILLLSA